MIISFLDKKETKVFFENALFHEHILFITVCYEKDHLFITIQNNGHNFDMSSVLYYSIL